MTNYSFLDLLNKEILIDEEDKKSIKISSIEIPKIQRDYVQGRFVLDESGNKKLNEKGRKFLDSIFEHLQKNEKMELDFVYGSIDEKEKKFEPLDGQQRLTTLFLLYWYIGTRELNHSLSEYSMLLEQLSKFTYSIRPSSCRFCELLCNLKKTTIDFSGQPSKQIENLSWFYKSYSKDLTINSMLFMLDEIHQRYNELNQPNLFARLENLRFYPFPLNGFSLTEDLYIKMNARGKELSVFENFKADFINWMQNKKINSRKFYEKVKYHNVEMPYYLMISNKFDNEWTDFFWNLFKNKNDEDSQISIDAEFMRFISRYIQNVFISDFNVEAANLDKNEDYINLKKSENYESFDIFEKILNEKIVKNLECVLDSFSKNWSTINLFCNAAWGDKIDALSQDFTNKSQVMFFALSSYLENNEISSENSKKSFAQYMRVAYNIMENADIDSVRVMAGCIRYFKDKLIKFSANIYEALSSEKIEASFASEQVKEEIKKAKFITKNPSEKWEAEFIKAESHKFFKGSIGFLIDDGMSLQKFSHRYDISQKLFDENGISERFRKNHILLKALIKKYQKYEDFCPASHQNFFTDKDEKEHYLHKKLAGDKSFISTLKEYCDLPSIDEVEKKVLEDGKLSSAITHGTEAENKIIRMVHNAFGDSDLLDWMEKNKAIRFSFAYGHYYVSAPRSWYSWIMLDSDRAKYFDYLKSKGFETDSAKVGRNYLMGRELFYRGNINETDYIIKFGEDNKVHFKKADKNDFIEPIAYSNGIDITEKFEIFFKSILNMVE